MHPTDRVAIGVDTPVKIPLTGSLYALVDVADVKLVIHHRWRPKKDKKLTYAIAHIGSKTSVRMHRLILNAPSGVPIDHKDHDGLNNQRTNLRLCTQALNCGNSRPSANNTSGYKGVTWDTPRHRWVAQIMVNRKHIYLGRWSDPWRAAQEYNAAALEAWGEFALLNTKNGE